MKTNTVGTSPLVYAIVAGIMYVLVILLGMAGVGYIESSLIVSGDDTATVKKIMDNELLFRIGFASEIIMFVLVVLL